MRIEEEYDTAEAIPADFTENYEQQEDGTFRLKLVLGLKSALVKERASVKTLKQERDEARASLEETSTETRQAREEATTAKREAAATAALQKSGGNIHLLLDKVAPQLAVGDGGAVFVVDAEGTPLLNDEGHPQSVDELIGAMRDDPVYAGAFKGSGNQGGGTPPGDVRGQRSETPSSRSQMTLRQKADYIKEHGSDAFIQLPA